MLTLRKALRPKPGPVVRAVRLGTIENLCKEGAALIINILRRWPKYQGAAVVPRRRPSMYRGTGSPRAENEIATRLLRTSTPSAWNVRHGSDATLPSDALAIPIQLASSIACLLITVSIDRGCRPSDEQSEVTGQAPRMKQRETSAAFADILVPHAAS